MRNPSTIRRPLLIGLAVSSILALSSAFGRMQQQSPATAGRACASDAECNDGVFCNGIERCAAAGCIAGTPPCNAGQRCDEGHRGCVNAGCDNPDRDGDGHRSPRCGGDDCDDNDANRFPGRTEVCDAAGHDEDCDPATYGARDVDGDNEDDIRCCNRETNGTLHCGTDYDDNNSAVRSGSMICDGPDAVVVSGSSSVKCPDGTKCLVQPNGTGICTVPPANYVAPERFTRPPAPPTLPRLPSDIRLDPENIPPAIPREQGGSPVTSNPESLTRRVSLRRQSRWAAPRRKSRNARKRCNPETYRGAVGQVGRPLT